MHIGFDAKRAFYNKSGLGNYSRNLLYSLAVNHPEHSYFLFTPKTAGRIHFEMEDQFNIIEPVSSIQKMIGPLWRLSSMKNEFKRLGLDIFHGLSHELPIGIEKTGVRSVVTVHDLIFLRFPEFYNPVDVKIYVWKLTSACRSADHIVAISGQTKDDLIKFLKISPDKISVIYQSCNHSFRNKFNEENIRAVKTKYALPERYLLYVGTIEERKNLMGIIKGMHIRNIDVPLIVIGKKVEKYYGKVLEYINNNKLRNIIFTEGVLSSELPIIFQNAECFIYPSFFEGFGIPIIEALESGTPVITSKGGCFSEAAGPGSMYIEPNDPEEIGEAVLKLLTSKELREKMINEGTEYAKNFTGEVIARKYMNLYTSLLK